MICFCFFAKKHIMIYFDDKKQNMRRNHILRILHFGQSSKFHCMETMWNVPNFHSNSTVCHPSTPERDDSNGFHSAEFMRLKVSSTLIPVGLNDFQFHINYTLIPQLVSCLCISNVELEISTVWY